MPTMSVNDLNALGTPRWNANKDGLYNASSNRSGKLKTNTDRATGNFALPLVNTYETNVLANSGTLPATHKAAILKHIPRLLRHSVNSKIITLGTCFGGELAGSLVKIIDRAGHGNLVNTNGVAGDYGVSTGLTGNRAAGAGAGSKYALFGASTVAATSLITANGTNWGFGVFSLSRQYNSAGVLAGSDTGNGTYLGYQGAGVNQSSIGGTTVTYFLPDNVTKQNPQGCRLHTIQSFNGTCTYRVGGYTLGTAAGSPGLPASNISLFGLNASGAFAGDASVGGYVVFSPNLTDAEALELEYFFESVNAEIGRLDMIQNILIIGDSNSRGQGLASPTSLNWGYLLGKNLGLVYRTGTAQTGTSSSITLDAGASAVDDFYKGKFVRITAGTGLNSVGLITSYVGATKVANITPSGLLTWTTPDVTSVFSIDSIDNQGLNSSTLSNNVDAGAGGGGWSSSWLQNRVWYSAGSRMATIYFISLGTNDVKFKVNSTTFITDYETYLNNWFNIGISPNQVVIMGVPATTDTGTYGSDRNQQILFNSGLLALAQKYGCGFVDLFSLTDGVGGAFQGDNLHYTQSMQATIANTIMTQLGNIPATSEILVNGNR
jgi:lysophospholipase L1-like esterase